MADAPQNLDAVRAFSFDCYGTLIDWEGGIRSALRDVPGLERVDAEAFLAAREDVEPRIEAESFRPYDEVLALSLQRAAEEFDEVVSDGAARRFAATLPDWPPHADAGTFLQRLRTLGRSLVILSNVTRAWLRLSVHRLPVPFDRPITAGDTRSYKPAPQHWLAAQAAMGLGESDFLHIAASLRHDVRPARALGVPVAWINRRREALPADLDPAFVVSDLSELGDALGLPPRRSYVR